MSDLIAAQEAEWEAMAEAHVPSFRLTMGGHRAMCACGWVLIDAARTLEEAARAALAHRREALA